VRDVIPGPGHAYTGVRADRSGPEERQQASPRPSPRRYVRRPQSRAIQRVGRSRLLVGSAAERIRATLGEEDGQFLVEVDRRTFRPERHQRLGAPDERGERRARELHQRLAGRRA
jgi:hypothetical protein